MCFQCVVIRDKHMLLAFLCRPAREPLNILPPRPSLKCSADPYVDFVCDSSAGISCFWRSNQWNFSPRTALPGGLWLLNSSIKELFYISGSRGFVHVSCVKKEAQWEWKKEIEARQKGFKSLAIVWKKLKNENLHPSLWCSSSYADIKCFSTQELFRLALSCVWITSHCFVWSSKKGEKKSSRCHPPRTPPRTMAM